MLTRRHFGDRAETDFILREVSGPDDLLITRFGANPAYAGKTVRQIAALRNSDPATTLMWLIAESEAKGTGETVVGTGMDERDIARLLRWPYTSISSDGELAGRHPRGYGAFTRILGRYVREQKVLTLEDAVRKMTSLSATNMGLNDRGTIKPVAAISSCSMPRRNDSHDRSPLRLVGTKPVVNARSCSTAERAANNR